MPKRQSKEVYNAYQREWYARNKERVRAKVRAAKPWRKNREKLNVAHRRSRAKLRAEILAAYGGQCVCCHEAEPMFLGLDHINGGGRKHRAEHGPIYLQVKKSGFPKDKYQLLCHNCNLAKGVYGRCPHKIEDWT